MMQRILILVWVVVGSITVMHAFPAEIHFSEIEFNKSLAQLERLIPLEDVHQVELDKPVIRGDSVFLDSFIRATMETYYIPGLATYIVKDGQCIWNGVYGYANLDDSIEVGDTTLFNICQTSKTITGTALMQLWERNMFDLYDDVNDYLPFTIINPFFPDSVISFWNLLTNTSSIRDNWPELHYFEFWGGDPLIGLYEFLQDYLTPSGAHYDPNNFYNWAPGTQYGYSHVGVALAGYLVEVLADSFAVYCRDSIFSPLSMNETSWFFADLDTNNIAYGYDLGDNSWFTYEHNSVSFYPAVTLKTSSIQLARFLTAFMQYGQIDGVRILDSTTVELMTTPQYPADPNFPPDSIGLIWFYDCYEGRCTWGRSGSWMGFSTNMAFCREENTGIVALANGLPFDCYYAIYYFITHELFEYAAQFGIAEAENHSLTTEGFSLYQNHPNPFSLTTSIRFILPHADHVSLKIYNIAGQKLVTLVDGVLQPGEHTLTFDAQDLRSGVYYYRLSTGHLNETKQFVLLK